MKDLKGPALRICCITLKGISSFFVPPCEHVHDLSLPQLRHSEATWRSFYDFAFFFHFFLMFSLKWLFPSGVCVCFFCVCLCFCFSLPHQIFSLFLLSLFWVLCRLLIFVIFLSFKSLFSTYFPLSYQWLFLIFCQIMMK